MRLAHIRRNGLALAATACGFALVLFTQVPYCAAPARRPERPAASWPMWGGTAQRNLVNLVEKNIATTWSTTPGKEQNILWSTRLGSKANGEPVFSGGKVFIGTNNQRPRDKNVKGDKGILMCFDEASGKFLWQIVHDKLAAPVNDQPQEGVCSTPVVEGDRLWYVSNRCEVICASTAGRVLWKLDMILALGVFPHQRSTCSPLVVGDTVFVVTPNGVNAGRLVLPAPNAPSFLALDKKTGKVLWKSNLPGKNIMHVQRSNPVYAVVQGKPQVVFPGGDGWLYSFEPSTGKLIWKFDCNPKGAKYKLGPAGTRNYFMGTPVIHEGKLYVAVGQDPEHKKGVGHLWCVDITKTPRNRDKDLSPYTAPKVEIPKEIGSKNYDKAGLVWHLGGVNPSEEGREFIFGRTLSTCAVDRGLCYACDFGGNLVCLDALTGKEHWSFDLEADSWSSPYVVDGKVYTGDEKGEVHIFEHAAKKKLVKKVQMKGKIRVTPVAHDGTLYVVTENPCLLWAIKAK